METLDSILLALKSGLINVPNAKEQILSLLDESKGVVSTSSPKSVDLHGVGKSECERSDTTEDSDEVVDLPLENRIDLENFCVCIKPNFYKYKRNDTVICTECTKLHITHINE